MTRIALGLVLLAAALVTASAVGTRPPAPPATKLTGPSIATEGSPIDPLDRCVQDRLHHHQGFGMSRFADGLIQRHEFVPESAEEESALEGLHGSGRTVGLYLGSRGLLAPEPDASGSDDDRDIGRPVVVTGGDPPRDMPQARDLRKIGREALAAADAGGAATGSLGRWSVDARVVRADRRACLTCHTAEGAAPFPSREVGEGRLKIGDALGVAIYVSAPSPGR